MKAPVTITATHDRIMANEAAAVRMIAELSAKAGPAVITPIEAGILRRDLRAAAKGPLTGVPFVVKDNIDALPFPTTGGSSALANHIPSQDATVVAQLRTAGAVMIGKTGLHELACGVTGNNAALGAIRCPHEPRRIAGGSSSGTAAAVAWGIAPFGLGTDTGGSIRIPAAFCSVVGFRPSTGRYSCEGVLIVSATRDTIGIIGSQVSDVALVDGILTADEPVALRRAPRIGLLDGGKGGLSHLVDQAILDAARQLERAGCTIVPVAFPGFQSADDDFGNVITFFEASEIWRSFAAATLDLDFGNFTKTIASPDVHAIFAAMSELPDSLNRDYVSALLARRHLIDAYERIFRANDLDVLAMSTVLVPPPLVGEDTQFLANGVNLPTFATLTRHSAPASIAGIPSISIPLPLRDGLPIGLQLEGRRYGDRSLLAVAKLAEETIGILAKAH